MTFIVIEDLITMFIVIGMFNHDVDFYRNLLHRAGLQAGQPCQTLLQVHWPVDQTAKLVVMVMMKMVPVMIMFMMMVLVIMKFMMISMMLLTAVLVWWW